MLTKQIINTQTTLNLQAVEMGNLLKSKKFVINKKKECVRKAKKEESKLSLELNKSISNSLEIIKLLKPTKYFKLWIAVLEREVCLIMIKLVKFFHQLLVDWIFPMMT